MISIFSLSFLPVLVCCDVDQNATYNLSCSLGSAQRWVLGSWGLDCIKGLIYWQRSPSWVDYWEDMEMLASGNYVEEVSHWGMWWNRLLSLHLSFNPSSFPFTLSLSLPSSVSLFLYSLGLFLPFLSFPSSINQATCLHHTFPPWPSSSSQAQEKQSQVTETWAQTKSSSFKILVLGILSSSRMVTNCSSSCMTVQWLPWHFPDHNVEFGLTLSVTPSTTAPISPPVHKGKALSSPWGHCSSGWRFTAFHLQWEPSATSGERQV